MLNREVARAATTVGQRTRTVSGGSPDAVPVIVEGRREDGRYLVRREHWPGTLAVPAVPSDAVIPYPCRDWLRFERGSLQGAYLFRPGRRGSPTPFNSHSFVAWNSYRSEFAGDNAQTGPGISAEEEVSLVDERTPVFARFDGFNQWVLYEDSGNTLLIGPSIEQEIPGFPVEMILVPGAALLFYEDGQFLRADATGITDLEPIGVPEEDGAHQEYKPREHPGRFCEDDGGVGEV